ncbi:DNA-binding protein [Pseudomonas aeruginosa]|uniref:Arc-like DNA binding domain protein n=1 Tax=Pseudomonas paraeruginosa TaxID=2994495 RepID=A0A2R3IQU7_9PSED|nr:arc-like DNA binding domain protein [Pseudomonas paraeruginosa]AWE93712.1 arc-like DNA binding domain protein [Pseudomonas paraeruginosa]KSD65757.1 DNA-binding protein [Pseudomonas aeruginosa]OTH87959.1 DNA-binding protein [Pseudomonas aeruginosa]HCE6465907.1 Arc family DNA-binding protein [Pseudomonas aeruginosa]
MSNSRTAEKFVVRLPDGMRDKIAETARDNHRSMNSEIIARLDQTLIDDQDRQHQDRLVALLNARIDVLEEALQLYRVQADQAEVQP